MADTNSGPLDITINTNEAKTAIPMIADGHLCRWRLNNLTSSKNEKGDTTVWEYKLVEPAPSTDGTEIRPGDMGSTFFERIQLYAKPDAKDPQWFIKKIATRLDALLGTGDEGNTKGKPTRPALGPSLVPDLVGKELVAKMAVRTGEYTGNEFKTVMYPGDIAA